MQDIFSKNKINYGKLESLKFVQIAAKKEKKKEIKNRIFYNFL